MSLAIALTKGRLEKQTVALLDQLGYGVEALKNKSRALVLQDSRYDLSYFLVKGHDACTYVHHGVADIGIVGKDTLYESSADYYELLDLGIGRCQFVLAGLANPLEKVGHLVIGTKYPKVTKDYFQRLGKEVDIIKIEGSVELGPLLGLCDGIVDIMETGTTLKENGLKVYDTVCPISARLIVNKASFKLKKPEIMKLIHDLERGLYAQAN